MADNFAFTEGSGKTGAADDVGGVLYPRVKLDLGTDGVTAPALAGAGAVATGVQRITLASDDPAVTLLDTIDTDTGVIAGDTTSIDGKITACNTGAVVLATGSAAIGKLAANTGVDIGDVDVTSIVPGVAAASLGKARDSALGATDTGVMALAVRDDTLTTLTPVDGDFVPLRVSSTGALHVTGGGGGTEYTEDVATANPIIGSAVMMERDDALGGLTPAEGDWASFRCDANGALWVHDNVVNTLLGTIDADTSTIAGDTTSIDGKITACNTGAVVISSGTVTTVSTVTTLSQLGGQAISMGEGVLAAGCQRVTLATDDDGVAHLATIAGDTTSLDTKVTACNTGAVVVASGAITETNSGTIAGDTTSIDGKITACNTGAVVVASGAITETNSASLAVVGGGTEATALRVTIANDSTGVVTIDGTVTADLSATDNAVLDAIVVNTAREAITGYGQAKLDHADVTTAQALIAAVADKKFYITSIILSVAAAGSYWIEDDDAAQITCKYTLAANGGLAISFPIDTPFKSTTVNKGLKVKGSAAGVIGCMITYYTLA